MTTKQPRCHDYCQYTTTQQTGRYQIRCTWALDIHEIGIWRLHKSLELVPLLFEFLRGVKKVDGERLSTSIGAAEMVRFIS